MTIWQYPRWLVVILAWLFALLAWGLNTGCKSQAALDARANVRTENLAKDPLLLGHQAQALGARGRVVILWGPGNVGPFWFNFSGSQGFAEFTFDPPPVPASQPAGGGP